jgi:hypothetical protein
MRVKIFPRLERQAGTGKGSEGHPFQSTTAGS